MSQNMKLQGYLECSAKEDKKLEQVFLDVLKLWKQAKQKQEEEKKLSQNKKICVLL